MKYTKDFPDPKLPWRKKPAPTLPNYYAGFSIDFASEIIRLYTKADALVLDPWNGAGTTTLAASLAGRYSVGVDLNPAAILIAKARLASAHVIADRTEEIIEAIRKTRAPANFSLAADDILLDWLDDKSVAYIRTLVKNVNKAFGFITPSNILTTSNEHALVLRIVAGMLKDLIKPLTGSNPTWIRLGLSRDKVTVDRKLFAETLVQNIKDSCDTFAELFSPSDCHAPSFVCSDAATVSLPQQFDLILGSPPYCTRIDYAVKTLPEAAILGISKEYALGEFRRSVLGSTITSKSDQLFPPPTEWGKKCTQFLEAVFSHRSKASATYYYRFHYRYFSGLFSSIKNISEMLKRGGHFAIVVQDSYYKEVHNDLPGIVQEIFENINAEVVQRQDFINNGSFSVVNSAAAAYGKGRKYFESVIVARK